MSKSIDEICSDIATLIQRDKLILFVGSGVSVGLGLPSWEDLIDYMANDLNEDKDLFKTHGDFLMLAEYYKTLKNGDLSSFYTWLKDRMNVSNEKLKNSEIHNLIVKLGIKTIYTTNYDKLIERSFHFHGKKPITIKKIDDLNKDSEGIEIIKFHGDINDKDSIVLTETDYFKRLDFNHILDIKFRADILGKSILFIGYSLSDINIRLLIFKFNQLWKESNARRRNKNYIFLSKSNKFKEGVMDSKSLIPFSLQGEDETENLKILLTRINEKLV
jgi:hypothetical protein